MLLKYSGAQSTKLHFPEHDAAAKGLPGRRVASADALLLGLGQSLLVPGESWRLSAECLSGKILSRSWAWSVWLSLAQRCGS